MYIKFIALHASISRTFTNSFYRCVKLKEIKIHPFNVDTQRTLITFPDMKQKEILMVFRRVIDVYP